MFFPQRVCNNLFYACAMQVFRLGCLRLILALSQFDRRKLRGTCFNIIGQLAPFQCDNVLRQLSPVAAGWFDTDNHLC